MRAIVLVLVLAACATDVPPGRDAHNVVTCGPQQQADVCELACVKADGVSKGNCRGSNPFISQTITCSDLYSFDGVEGCCLVFNEDEAIAIRFFACD